MDEEFNRPAALERISELERANEELRSELTSRDDFLAVASHDLRSPVTALSLQVQILQRALDSGTTELLTEPELARRLAAIQRQLKRLTAQIDRLLDISLIAHGRIILEPDEVDLVELVREAIASHTDLGEAAGAITLSAPASLMGRWDRVRLEQIVGNLLTNAIKYGSLQPIEFVVEVCESTARIMVRDHGVGIAPEHQARIFERFVRAVPQQQYGGFGLGLWITCRLVKAMGGEITVSSQPGHGTTFTVTLPRGGAVPPAAGPTGSTEP